MIGAVASGGSSTSAAPATTTTASIPQTTTTLARTTTTTVAKTPDSVAAAFPAKFEANRTRVLGVLQSDDNIKSIDKFLFDPAASAVVLSVTSKWATPDNQANGAWEITRAMAALWAKPSGAYYDPLWMPGFKFDNSGKSYNCPATLMADLAESRASRSDWAASC